MYSYVSKINYYPSTQRQVTPKHRVYKRHLKQVTRSMLDIELTRSTLKTVLFNCRFVDNKGLLC
jgi:hypothetical protein